MPDWTGGAYIAEEVAPWIDYSGTLVAATGGASVGTTAPGTPDEPTAPPESPGHAKTHPLQPSDANNHRRPAVRTGRYVAAQPFDAPATASGNLQLLGLSHAKAVLISPEQLKSMRRMQGLGLGLGHMRQIGDIGFAIVGGRPSSKSARGLIPVRIKVSPLDPSSGQLVSDFVTVRVGAKTVDKGKLLAPGGAITVWARPGQKVSVTSSRL